MEDDSQPSERSDRSIADAAATDRLDRAFDLLADSCRRRALYRLRNRAGPVTVRELAIAIVHGPSTDASADGESVEAVWTALYHKHLPRLDDADLVAFDPDRRSVEPTDELRTLEPHLTAAERAERADSRSRVPAAPDRSAGREESAGSTPAIESVYFDGVDDHRSATCRFANGAQLRVRRADDETLVTEVFRPRDPMTVWRSWRTESADSATVHLLTTLARWYAEQTDRGAGVDPGDRSDADAIDDELPYLTAALTDERPA